MAAREVGRDDVSVVFHESEVATREGDRDDTASPVPHDFDVVAREAGRGEVGYDPRVALCEGGRGDAVVAILEWTTVPFHYDFYYHSSTSIFLH